MAKKKFTPDDLKMLVRHEAARYLEEENVTSVGIGYKTKDNKKTKELCIQFTVGQKVGLESLDEKGFKELPKSFDFEGMKVPTDVIERTYKTSQMTATPQSMDRKSRIDPIVPGVSVGHPETSAGTVGCVVYDAITGREYILSNWHVLNGEDGWVGDAIVQPGTYDDNRVEENLAGTLVRSHLGLAGDCAIATIDTRTLDPEIMGLGVTVSNIATPNLGDKVIKSGRTTSVTYGIVSRVHTTVKLFYGAAGMHQVGCFEYIPDEEHPPANGEVSMGGDSGSAVMLVNDDQPTETMVGLHFAGETGNAREHGLACYASSVFTKLQISPTVSSDIQKERLHGAGFNNYFLARKCSIPSPMNGAVSRNLFKYNGEKVFDYTHFSLVLDKKRKFASWVAWNIDGANIKILGRRGIRFTKDPKLPPDCQIGNELYKHNALDRGHIARRAELCWGPMNEAKKANKDSFYFTNMTPQHERFNQSKKAGLWGNLENAIFDGAKIKDLKVSVFAGPIFNDTDPLYRNVQIPKEFWKVVCYIDEDTNELKHHAFILTQEDLIHGLEALDLDDFELYEVPVQDITHRIGFVFKDLEASMPESLAIPEIRKIESIDDILKD